jgi:hypothetical protein
MKTNLSLHLIRFALFCTAAVLTLSTGISAFAQGKHVKARALGLPAMVVEASSLTPPDMIADETIAVPDGTVAALPIASADGSFTLPDGSVVALPSRTGSDGTMILPDGSSALRNANGTLSLTDGTTVETAAFSASAKAPQPIAGN